MHCGSAQKTLALENPGSPIVTSNGSRDPVVWVHASGKYNQPVIARGTVFVGTDRVQAFGLHESER
jgi:hypothetical protein